MNIHSKLDNNPEMTIKKIKHVVASEQHSCIRQFFENFRHV